MIIVLLLFTELIIDWTVSEIAVDVAEGDGGLTLLVDDALTHVVLLV